ncbi:hypothetical protein CVT25_014695 [Psilocybe cyanescens]|uniref:Uncharacterized protein n=1 Tax=Psilocybe cyanescens TaxID=93625 RepID=A0A409XBT1_PSICY|nr:hypothetical protein CVT25_014695 [Psilocybe cyanescens]
MDVMKNKIAKAPSRREIELSISLSELTTGGRTGQAAWISMGLKLEEAMYNLRAHIRKLLQLPTTAQKLDMVNKRRAVLRQIESFSTSANDFLGAHIVDALDDPQYQVLDDDLSGEEGPEWEVDTPGISRSDPEWQVLPFPS